MNRCGGTTSASIGATSEGGKHCTPTLVDARRDLAPIAAMRFDVSGIGSNGRSPSSQAQRRRRDEICLQLAGNRIYEEKRAMLIGMQEARGDASSFGRRYSRVRGSRRLGFSIQTVLTLVLALVAHCAFASSNVTDDEQQQAALRTLMGTDPAPADSVKGVALSPWAHGPSASGPLWVVAALVQRPTETVDAELWTGVLTRDGQGFRLLASDRSERVDTSPMLWSPFLAMDVIPYRISAQETAFGVLFGNNYTSTAHSDSTGILNLYRYRDGRVTPVFSALTDWSTYDKDGAAECEEKNDGKRGKPGDAQQDSCDAENTTETHYVLSFSPHMTNGHYDLLVRPKGKAGAGKSARFTWNGNTYQPRRFTGD
ncbi:hypothetical protein [Burkholderia cepacia]|uniref:hypothetical protein n=1 Tax=Burkholderia cepacia TaxID=292 RepID=UPI0007583526|nr:hypothetical protein [Burkholderia cepacia]KVA65762.1 hypothetical protein WI49_12975 [Burkholderia cepacia]KVB47759.1 hypothetical protein WI59_17335 [Burkholderia cepacia]KVB67248.1 hypothetical protein WI60_32915 [Burkholderia cepacia]KVB95049.1 hypothetical protein WI65_09395 [Burkholderia cepacia]KVC15290.1 hypothetical protein WI68_31285 [Burkholderia cepacia]